MVQEYLTIQEAADLVNKSFQTLRRAIKSNKIKYRRQRTPQGFSYLIMKDSLFDYYKLNQAMQNESAVAGKSAEEMILKAEKISLNNLSSENCQESSLKSIPLEKAENVEILPPEKSNKKSSSSSSSTSSSSSSIKTSSEAQEIEPSKKEDYITKEDLSSITQALEKMISQHSEERQNFIRLINTLNEKIFTLESQVKLLSAPKKSWLTFWKK